MLRNLSREVDRNETFLRLGDLHPLCEMHDNGLLGSHDSWTIEAFVILHMQIGTKDFDALNILNSMTSK